MIIKDMRLAAEVAELIGTEDGTIIQTQLNGKDVELSIFDSYGRVSVVELTSEEVDELIELLSEYKYKKDY